jgi:hypothetical protein
MELNKEKLFTEKDLSDFIDFVINEKNKQHGVGTGLSNRELIQCHLSTYRIFQMKDLRKIYMDMFIQSLQQEKNTEDGEKAEVK